MSKSRKQILQELLDLENEKVEEIQEAPKISLNIDISSKEIEPENENPHSITRAKKPRTEKQLEAFDRAKAIRDANTLKRKEEARLLAEQERKIIEDKLIKKAISLKKKQIKKQAVLDEVSDDDTPLEKVKEIAEKVKSKETITPVRTPMNLPADKPIMKYTFF
jgi:hypothetical protein